MALIQSEIDLCNLALSRIAAGSITLANQTGVSGVACNLHYEKARNSLLRKYRFSFSTETTEIYQVKTITLDKAPRPALWAAGDTLFGISSGVTAQIVSVTSGIEYILKHLTGDFETGETIINTTPSSVTFEDIPLTWEDEPVYLYDDQTVDLVVCGAAFTTLAVNLPTYKWSYQYYLPEDCLRFISAYEDDGTDLPEDRYHIDGRYFKTNYETVNIRYVKKVTDPAEFDELFKDMLVLALAIRLLPSLAGTDAKLLPDLKQEFRELASSASTIDFQEGNTTGRSDWNNARY
jgi:hypothetical protein